MSMVLVLGCMMLSAADATTPLYEADFVFDPEAADHGHVHASCIVECPNGDLRVVWYENGPKLPPPYFSEQRDKSDDVRIGSARKPAGAPGWEPPFVMADTFGVSDNNPCMVIDKDQRLWLVYPTLLGVPKWTWASALVRYSISSDYQKPGVPTWSKQDILVPHPLGLREIVDATLAKLPETLRERLKQEVEKAYQNPLVERLGWMPRAHPLVRSDGAVVLPLSNENLDIACMAITKDGGETWTIGSPVPEAGLTQPTLVEFPDGQIVAFFRNGGPERRIKRCESSDGGMTWGEVTLTDRLHPGAGIEAILAPNGNLVLIYNDKETSPRDKLAVSISTDRGKTWQWTRHLENTPEQRFDYPSLIAAKDGTFHASYSYNLKTIKHVRFNEAWVREGD